jgi:hypothetical protein
VTTAVFAVDIVLTFFTEVYIEKEFCTITNLRSIAMVYLKGWFWFDTLSVLPISAIFSHFKRIKNYNKFLRITRLVRVYNMVRLLRISRLVRTVMKAPVTATRAEEKAAASTRRTYLFLGFLVILMHLLSCMWIFIAAFKPELNWLNSKVAALESSGEDFSKGTAKKYILSLYLTTQTLTTVGYGDITPTNSTERIAYVIVMAFGVVIFGFLGGTLASFLQIQDELEAMNKEQLSKMALVMRI